mgnify:CR=1 FL=1|tara:strand:- start:19 stop:498 length:480 start_codon:yes stop_codon:yes gene_type:complete
MIELPDSVLDDTLSKHFIDHINRDHIVKLISSKLTDTDRGFLLQLVLSKTKEYKTVNIGDIVEFKQDGYELKDYGNLIELSNAKLYNDGFSVGIVTGSDSYSSEYDKYSRKKSVEVIGHRDGQFTIIKSTIVTSMLRKLQCKPTSSSFTKKYVNLQTGL